MYGKVFESIYDGTLCGHWQAIVTMQQLIVLANRDGVVDMTPEAISTRTSIPLKIIAAGLEHLAKPDPFSRTPGNDGKRIELLDDHRPWGWRLVNHAKYMRLRNMEQKREADRVRIVEKRKKNKDVATESHDVADVAHLDLDVDLKNKTPLPPSGAFLKFWTEWPSGSRKKSQGKCWKVWQRGKFDQLIEAICMHVAALKLSADWQKGYVPAPLVYLNQRQWEGADLTADPGIVTPFYKREGVM